MRLLLLLSLASAPVVVGAQEVRVTLLGTGSPAPSPVRFGPATLVQAGGQTLLFDVGRGAVVRLWQRGIPVRSVDAVFLTHLHHDHFNGLADLWLTGWLRTEYGQRQTPLRLIGPVGTETVARGLELAYSRNVDIRVADEHLPREGAAFEVAEFTAPEVVYSQGGVEVRAFPVDHGEAITPAVGFRVDYAGLSVVLSGDTTYDERLVESARGVDLLIHEVMAWNDEAMRTVPGAPDIAAHHTTPEEAGRIFAQAAPALAVYTHLVVRGVTDDQLEARTRTAYDGPLVVGHDLMTFVVRPGAVAVEASD